MAFIHFGVAFTLEDYPMVLYFRASTIGHTLSGHERLNSGPELGFL